jgi:AcrR family transcriptional regulator
MGSKGPAARPPRKIKVIEGSATRRSRRERVLDEAAHLLNARGVSQTSLAVIAERLGFSRAALYYYVEDLPDLVFQCYRRACEISAQRLELAIRGGGLATEIVARFVEGMLAEENPEIASLSEIAVLNAEQQATILGLNEAVHARLAAVLDGGVREGSLRSCDTEVAAHVIMSMISWVPLSRRWSIAVAPQGRARVIEAVLNAVFDGVAVRRRLPLVFTPIDLSPLEFRASGAFDREAQASAKREALLLTASRLFNRKGVDATSLDEIAAQIGVTKRTLYHYVGDKEALLLACNSRAYRMFHFIAEKNLHYVGGRIEAIAAVSYAGALISMREDLCPLRPMVGFDGLSPEGQAQANANSTSLTRAYDPIARASAESGELVWRDPQLAMTISPGVDSWLSKLPGPIPPERQDHIAREISNLVCVGLKPV